ncbi:MAG: NifB/NifX family molybdenum-iron cluster-binding protein [Verrucomicrobiota bacterium]|nr:NifB/NifX family molybdenum-iron cluster-binding protein [Verrucomicrobiota bacterium]
MYKYLFGPVPSRRLGMSLGVDLVPHKVCTLNCVYCECGPTTNLTNERKEYVPVDEVLKELADFLKNNPAPDYITFSGAGEPTLNSRIGEVLQFIKENSQNIPIAVLTNGTLFSDKKVRTELLNADLVLPSLDAASDSALRKIDRCGNTLNVEDYIQGLVDFRKEFKGKIWLEVLVLPGYNDSIQDLTLLKKAIERIKPDQVQLNSLDRPGAVDGLRPANIAELREITELWGLDNVKIIASVPERKKIKSYRKDTENVIMETISRRPCTLDDLAKITGMHVNEINKYLGVLENDKQLETIRQKRGLFYQKTKKEKSIMKIAVPTAEGRLAMHFGHCEKFVFVDVNEESKEIVGSVDATPPAHAPGVLPKWLREQNVNVIIAGGMGSRAQQLFAEQNIKVIIGAPSETPEKLVQAYLDGVLASGDNLCDH